MRLFSSPSPFPPFRQVVMLGDDGAQTGQAATVDMVAEVAPTSPLTPLPASGEAGSPTMVSPTMASASTSSASASATAPAPPPGPARPQRRSSTRTAAKRKSSGGGDGDSPEAFATQSHPTEQQSPNQPPRKKRQSKRIVTSEDDEQTTPLERVTSASGVSSAFYSAPALSEDAPTAPTPAPASDSASIPAETPKVGKVTLKLNRRGSGKVNKPSERGQGSSKTNGEGGSARMTRSRSSSEDLAVKGVAQVGTADAPALEGVSPVAPDAVTGGIAGNAGIHNDDAQTSKEVAKVSEVQPSAPAPEDLFSVILPSDNAAKATPSSAPAAETEVSQSQHAAEEPPNVSVEQESKVAKPHRTDSPESKKANSSVDPDKTEEASGPASSSIQTIAAKSATTAGSALTAKNASSSNKLPSSASTSKLVSASKASNKATPTSTPKSSTPIGAARKAKRPPGASTGTATATPKPRPTNSSAPRAGTPAGGTQPIKPEPSFLDSLFSGIVPQTEHEKQLQKEREEKARAAARAKEIEKQKLVGSASKMSTPSFKSTSAASTAEGRPTPITLPSSRLAGASLQARLAGQNEARKEEIAKLRRDAKRKREEAAAVSPVFF